LSVSQQFCSSIGAKHAGFLSGQQFCNLTSTMAEQAFILAHGQNSVLCLFSCLTMTNDTLCISATTMLNAQMYGATSAKAGYVNDRLTDKPRARNITL